MRMIGVGVFWFNLFYFFFENENKIFVCFRLYLFISGIKSSFPFR